MKAETQKQMLQILLLYFTAHTSTDAQFADVEDVLVPVIQVIMYSTLKIYSYTLNFSTYLNVFYVINQHKVVHNCEVEGK